MKHVGLIDPKNQNKYHTMMFLQRILMKVKRIKKIDCILVSKKIKKSENPYRCKRDDSDDEDEKGFKENDYDVKMCR